MPAASPRAGDGEAAASVQAETSPPASPAAAHREKVPKNLGARVAAAAETQCVLLLKIEGRYFSLQPLSNLKEIRGYLLRKY